MRDTLQIGAFLRRRFREPTPATRISRKQTFNGLLQNDDWYTSARLLRQDCAGVLRHLLTLSSPGVPFMSRRVEDVETMINNVSTYGAALKR